MIDRKTNDARSVLHCASVIFADGGEIEKPSVRLILSGPNHSKSKAGYGTIHQKEGCVSNSSNDAMAMIFFVQPHTEYVDFV